jgi:hypothetical protein
MKRIVILIACVLASYAVQAQIETHYYTGGYQFSVGRVFSQALEIDKNRDGNTTVTTFDFNRWTFPGDHLVGYAYGLGVRSYKIPSEFLLTDNTDETKHIVRLEPHLGLALKVGVPDALLVLSPQVGFSFDNKVKFTTALNADLVIAEHLSLGVTYRASTSRLVSSHWNTNRMSRSYVLIEPALEFRVGICIFGEWEELYNPRD